MATVIKKEGKCKKPMAFDSDDSDEYLRLRRYHYVYSSGSDDGKEEEEDEEDDDKSELLLDLKKLSLGPKKKLLVFNLNGVLVHRGNKSMKSSFPKDQSPDGVYRGQAVYKRPFLEEFMKFCLQRFEVGIWSSAQVQNTEGVLGCAFQEFRSRFLFVWDQDRCSDYGYKVPGNKRKPLFFKELSQLWSSLGDHSSRGCQFSESNTLLIDDEPYKALLNPPNTGVFLET